MDKHQSVGGPYGIRGFPTIKVFGFDKNDPQDYNGKFLREKYFFFHLKLVFVSFDSILQKDSSKAT